MDIARNSSSKTESAGRRSETSPTLAPVPSSDPPAPRKAGRVSRSYLVNKLNYVNFMNGTIDVIFCHRRYDRRVVCKALPFPCAGERLECRFQKPGAVETLIDNYEIERFYVGDGVKALQVEPAAYRIQEEGIEFDLPERCLEIRNRREIRYPCRDIPVQVIQNSMLFKGRLLEFSTGSFQVELAARPPQTFECIDPDLPVDLIVIIADEMVYSGTFSVVRQGDGADVRDFVLEPKGDSLRRFHPRTFRSNRLQLVPSPNLLFTHPLTGNMVNLKVADISGSGMSVTERLGGSLLLPGMILPEVELSFAGIFHIRFKAQVVYRNVVEDDKGKTDALCGLAILDMSTNEHLKLLSILHQAENENAYINNEVEMSALWDFFFETGFIYPKKYQYIADNKEAIKATYWKLYTQNPTIARHFIYQEKGRILGHMAMVRLYDKAWMIHHHAARKRDQIRAGIDVLNQIGRFGYDSHRLYSLHMKYLLCYFRPENHFPNSVFGGFARHNTDPKACSMDGFAYLHHRPGEGEPEALAPGWSLSPTGEGDVQELSTWYDFESGGLMLAALDLEPSKFRSQAVEREYESLGFTKSRTLISLKRDSRLKAVIMVHRSDIGLNLSDLTHCVKIFVVDAADLDRHLLMGAVETVFHRHGLGEMPVLIHPNGFAEDAGIDHEKTYNLWIIDIRHSDQYFEFIDKLFRRARG